MLPVVTTYSIPRGIFFMQGMDLPHCKIKLTTPLLPPLKIKHHIITPPFITNAIDRVMNNTNNLNPIKNTLQQHSTFPHYHNF